MRKFIVAIAIICMMMLTLPTLAQNDTPAEVDFVVQTLAAALNTPIDPTTLDSVSWQPVNFTSTALGCPIPQQTYAPIEAVGFQVFVGYQGIVYDYRVTTGGEYVILCGTQEANFVVTPQPQVVTTAVVPVTNNALCEDALAPRLAVGELARTTPVLGSNIRDLPSLDATDIGTIPASAQFVVTTAPECGADGYYWWGVNYDGIDGWVLQGQDGLYYVEPIPQPLLATTTIISALNVDSLIPLSEIEGNLLGISAWSADGQFVAIADASTANPAIWLYFVNDLSQVPVSVEVTFDTTALEFSPDGSLLAVGDPDGNIHLIELVTYTVVRSFSAHDTAVLDIDFSPDGRYMVAVDDNYTARFYGIAP